MTYVLNENVSVGQLEMIVQLTDKTDTYNGQALEFKNKIKQLGAVQN